MGVTFLRGDLNEPVSVRGKEVPIVPSPSPGVERRMLDRIGGEVARATTIVSFGPDTAFPYHVHIGGEEFLVLAGTFSDDFTGDCSDGFYVRHPIGSSHHAWSRPGCTIFVHLCQMTDDSEKGSTVVDTRKWRAENPGFREDGTRVLQLYRNGKTGEEVSLEFWNGDGCRQWADAASSSGLELFVVSGEVKENDETFGEWSWWRLPAQSVAKFVLKGTGLETVLWVKKGPLQTAAHILQSEAGRE